MVSEGARVTLVFATHPPICGKDVLLDETIDDKFLEGKGEGSVLIS